MTALVGRGTLTNERAGAERNVGQLEIRGEGTLTNEIAVVEWNVCQ